MSYFRSFMFACMLGGTLLTSTTTSAALDSLAAATTAKQMISIIDSRIRELMDKAISDADYLLAGALSDLKSVLNAWEETNKAILNDAAVVAPI
ncbi:hypothetical protein [Marinobacter sp. DY40_1A1]|uniref:hypothetical protein n=1 Tax=Marinobacter sp. DY40_1A1 TaxID=2583229 RepID=UPI001907A972|nr:hypothetical protein [Marinobacter sp. DY40_1A1]MBK1888388.1 hypothetical protein [Marinobacter sp. DY40_1A1]